MICVQLRSFIEVCWANSTLCSYVYLKVVLWLGLALRNWHLERGYLSHVRCLGHSEAGPDHRSHSAHAFFSFAFGESIASTCLPSCRIAPLGHLPSLALCIEPHLISFVWRLAQRVVLLAQKREDLKLMARIREQARAPNTGIRPPGGLKWPPSACKVSSPEISFLLILLIPLVGAP